MKKARSLLQNFGQRDNKNGRQVFSDLPAAWSSYAVVREFRSILKAKTAVLYLQICILKSRHLSSKKPRQNRGFCGTYLFYVPFMAEQEGFEPSVPVRGLLDFESSPLWPLRYCSVSINALIFVWKCSKKQVQIPSYSGLCLFFGFTLDENQWFIYYHKSENISTPFGKKFFLKKGWQTSTCVLSCG